MTTKVDMCAADIVAMLHKNNKTMAGLSRQAGLRSSPLANVLTRPWPKGEFKLAEALGIHPSVIWPSRFFDKEGNLIERHKIIRKKPA